MMLLYFIVVIIFSGVKIFPSQVNKNEIVVGIKNSPPFVIKNSDNNFGGLSIDLWNAIADSLNLKYRFKEYDLSGLISALENEKINLCINPLTVTSDRAKRIDFTQPFYITNLQLQLTKNLIIILFCLLLSFFQ